MKTNNPILRKIKKQLSYLLNKGHITKEEHEIILKKVQL